MSDQEMAENSDSSEDVPLKSFSKKGKKKISDDDDDNDAEEGEETNGRSSRKRRSSAEPVSYAEDDEEEEEEEEEEAGGDDDDSSEDEDVPLVALKGNSPKKAPKKAPAKKKATPAKKKAKAASSSSKATTTTTPSSSKYRSPSAALYGSECDKGLLIQRLLVRWWYAIQWPSAESVPDKPPQDCDALDGFPGVYIQTSGDEVGRIVDLRDKEKAPSFANLAKKSSDELQELLVTAIEGQKKALIEAEGTGTETEKELNSLLKWAKKVKGKSADKDAIKVLKAAKMSLD